MPTNPLLTDVWVYLAQTPLLWLTATLLAYLGADWLYQRAGRMPLLNPVVVAIALLVGILRLTDTDYQTYFDGAQFVHFLLGPATVALAIPLYSYIGRLRAMLLPLVLALLGGSATGILAAVGIGWLLGLERRSYARLRPSLSPPRLRWASRSRLAASRH